MAEESNGASNVADMVKATGEVLDKIPLYQDAVQPAAKEVGKSLETITKAVNTALLPVNGLIWGFDQIKDFVQRRVAEKLEGVPPENIQPPKPHVAVPAIDALRYTGAEPNLSELYANLLATSMDKATAENAHPGFVDMVKNMSPDEARIMKFLAKTDSYAMINILLIENGENAYTVANRYVSLLGADANVQHINLLSSYIDNLERLGLIYVDDSKKLNDNEPYERIENNSNVKKRIDQLNAIERKRTEIKHLLLGKTSLGFLFTAACVDDKRASANISHSDD